MLKMISLTLSIALLIMEGLAHGSLLGHKTHRGSPDTILFYL